MVGTLIYVVANLNRLHSFQKLDMHHISLQACLVPVFLVQGLGWYILIFLFGFLKNIQSKEIHDKEESLVLDFARTQTHPFLAYDLNFVLIQLLGL